MRISFTKFPKFKLLFLTLLIFFTYKPLESQDLFGSLPVYPTNFITKSKVNSSGHIFITLWGAGVYKSTDKGNTWNPENNGLSNVYVTDIEFISETELLLSTMGGGVFKSNSITNVNWVSSNAGLKNLDVRTIKKYPNGLILIGTYGSGIYTSSDKGLSWNLASKGILHKDITCIEVADNGWIVAGTYGGGVFQSRDTAKTWSKQSSGLKNLFINDIKRSKEDFLYVATNGRGVSISVNDGVAWAELDTTLTLPGELQTIPIPDMNATAITFNKSMNPVFGTRYGGVFAEDNEIDFTWIPTEIRGIGVTTMCQNADNMYAFSPNFKPHSSNTMGEFWTGLSHTPMFSFAREYTIFSFDEKEVIKVSEINFKGVIERSTDDGKTWSQPVEFHRAVHRVAKDSSGTYYIATTDGLYKTNSNFSTLNLIGFGGKRVFDFKIAPNGTFFAMVDRDSNRRVLLSTDKGTTWVESFSRFDIMIPSEVLGVNYNGHIYATIGDKLAVTSNNGTSWITSLPFPSRVNCIAFFRDNTVLVGTQKDGLYKSTSFGVYQKVNEYPAKTIQKLHVDINDNLYASGVNDFVYTMLGSSYWEATYKSIDKGKKFININKDFHGEQVIDFTSNSLGDLYMTVSSGMIYRAINKNNLGTPSLIAIQDKSVDIENGVEFSWTSAKRAELYELQISYDEEFDYAWESVVQLDTSHILVGKLTQNLEYFWRVRAKNHEAVGEWSEVRSFMTKLSTPELISPSNQEVNVPVYATLLWNSSEGANQYLIQVSQLSDFSEIDHEWTTSDTNTISPLLGGRTKYFWRVKASNEISTSNWSLVWSFETVFGPPNLISPTNESIGIDVSAMYLWEKATEVSSYDIQVSEFIDFSVLIMDSSYISTSSVLSNLLEYDKTYYWRVRSRNDEVVSEWSLIWKFRTAYQPVVLISPEDNSVNVTINSDFVWQEHASQNFYEIEVAKSEDFSNNVIFETIENLSSFSPVNLEPYLQYYWRVRVKSDENTGLWSDVFTFKTSVDKIELRFPNNLTSNHPVSINFLWFSTEGAATYHLQISGDEQFNDLIFSQDTISNTTFLFSGLNSGTVYYWRVRAVTPEGVGEWSDVWNFKTGNDIPVLVLPENGDNKVVNPIKFQWQAVTGAITYELNVSESSVFSDNIISKNDISTVEYTTSELDYPKTYYWRIRAKSEEGNLNWSQVWSFGTKDPNSVKDNIVKNEAETYPNPANNIVTFKLINNNSGTAELKIMEITGRTVYIGSVEIMNDLINFDCNELSNGLYFFAITTLDNNIQGEFIINR